MGKSGGEEFIEKMRKEAEEKERKKEDGSAYEPSGGNVDVNCGDGNGGNGNGGDGGNSGNGGNGGNDVGDGGGGDQAGDPWFRYLSDRADRAIDDLLSEEMEDIYKGLTPLAKQTIYFLQLLNRRDSIKDKSKIWDNGVDGFVKFGGEEFIEKMRKEAEEKGRRKEEKEKEGGLADEFSGGNVD